MDRAGLGAWTFRDPSRFVVRHVVDPYFRRRRTSPSQRFPVNAVERIMLTFGHDYDALS